MALWLRLGYAQEKADAIHRVTASVVAKPTWRAFPRMVVECKVEWNQKLSQSKQRAGFELPGDGAMRIFLRYHLGSLAALAAYLVVNVGAAALHHHQPAESCPSGLPTVPATNLPFEGWDSSDDDDGEEECLLCCVLHLARILPIPCHVEAAGVLTGNAFPVAAITRLSAVETATYPRAPPLP
jgi:hypothetical protein